MSDYLKKIVISILILFACNTSYSQYNETIRTGRPGEAIGPFTVGARVFQLQAGFDYGEGSKNQYLLNQSYSAGSVFRMGLTETFELGAAFAYLNLANVDGNSSSGISALSIRLRNNIYVGKGLIPSIGVQLNFGFPFVSEDYKSEYVHPKITIMTAQRLGKRFGFTTNWGAFWNGNDAIPTAFYVLNLSFDLTDKWGLFVEHYARITEGNWNGYLNGGGSFLVNNDLQLDLYAGYGEYDKINLDWYISAGISWRVRFKEKNQLNENE